MWYVKSLELQNFKCYKDLVCFNLGNFQDLKAVLGQNGCGNPVIMEAMAFILDSSTKARRLSDLIYKKSSANELDLISSVTLVCSSTDVNFAVDGRNIMEKKFTRKISDTSYAVFQVDGKFVTKEKYFDEIQVLGLVAEDQHCSVVAGASIMLSMKSRQQQTEILFETSSAESLKQKKKFDQLQLDITSKKLELRQHLREKKHTYYMFKLFHWEREKLQLEKSVEQITESNENFKKDVARIDGECRKKNNKFKMLEKEFWKMELNVRNLQENQVATQARLKWQEEATNSAREKFEKAKKEFSEHKLEIDKLWKRIEVCEAQFLEIKCETISEYADLKVEAEEKLGRFFQSLKDLRQRKTNIQLGLDSFNLQMRYFLNKLAQTEEEFERGKAEDGDAMFEKVNGSLINYYRRERCQDNPKRKRLEKEPSANKRLCLDERSACDMKRNVEILNIEAKRVLSKTSIQQSELSQFISQFNDSEGKVINYVLQTIKKGENSEADFGDLIKFFRDKIKENEARIESWREKLNDINGEIAEVEKLTKSIESQIFKDFCQSLGASNIIEFRVNQMLRDNQQSAKKIELMKEINKLKNEIDYENRTNLKYKEMKLAEEVVNFRENDFKVTIAKELKQRQELIKREEELEDVKINSNIMKAEINSLESEIYELTSKNFNLDAKQDFLRLRIRDIIIKRHEVLLKCKEQRIEIFLHFGDWSDVNFYDGNNLDQLDESNIYMKEDKLKFDFSSLSPNLKKVTALNKNMRIGDFNFQQFESIAEKVELQWICFEDVLRNVKNLESQFMEVKSERFLQFTQMFKHVNSCVDKIYKGLTKCGNARATLTLENVEEPYLDGIKYEFVVPGKSMKATSEMRIEDRYVAAMALLLSTQTLRKSSADVMNEINSKELDQENIDKLANFIQIRKQRDRFRLLFEQEARE